MRHASMVLDFKIERKNPLTLCGVRGFAMMDPTGLEPVTNRL